MRQARTFCHCPIMMLQLTVQLQPMVQPTSRSRIGEGLPLRCLVTIQGALRRRTQCTITTQVQVTRKVQTKCLRGACKKKSAGIVQHQQLLHRLNCIACGVETMAAATPAVQACLMKSLQGNCKPKLKRKKGKAAAAAAVGVATTPRHKHRTQLLHLRRHRATGPFEQLFLF